VAGNLAGSVDVWHSVKRSVVGAACLCLLLALAACARGGGARGPDLDGTWTLVSGTSAGQAIPLVAGRSITLVIDGGSASGRACNQYSGTVTLTGTRIRFSAMAMTEMACEEPMMTAESAYQAALAAVDTATRSGDALTLSGSDAELRFRLEPPVANADLVGTTWTLTTLLDGQVASSAVGSPATLLLAADGSMTGSTGCRPFAARYTLSGSTVTVSGFSANTYACTVLTAPQDQRVAAVLSGQFTFRISGTGLTLSAPDGSGLGYVAGAGSGSGSGSGSGADATPVGPPATAPTTAQPVPLPTPAGPPVKAP